MYVAKFRQYIVPRSVAYVCIQSVCDVTVLERWGGYAPPVSAATEIIIIFLDTCGERKQFLSRVNKVSITRFPCQLSTRTWMHTHAAPSKHLQEAYKEKHIVSTQGERGGERRGGGETSEPATITVKVMRYMYMYVHEERLGNIFREL